MRRVRRVYNDERSRYRPRAGHVCVNWGSSSFPVWSQRYFNGPQPRWINSPQNVRIAGNKLLTFQKLAENSEISIPEWTTDKEVAKNWISDGAMILCRVLLNGHSGRGIHSCESLLGFIDAPLYVKYAKKKHEYRVHVAFGKVIDVQQKRKRRDFQGEVNTVIRNHQNGWVYCREDITEPSALRQQALLSVAALNLDFGAVDIIWNQHYDKCYVLEVNTAPGLEGTTLQKYVRAFMEKLSGR